MGDIVDFWAMSRSIHWSRNQNTVVQKLLKRARHGTRVIFVPGNHDEVLEHHDGRMELIHWIAESPQTANPQPERLLQAVGAE